MVELREYKYSELCEVMNWKKLKGNSKKSQYKILDTLCKYHLEGYGKSQKIIIDEIYKQKKYKIDNRKYNKNQGHSTSKYPEIKDMIHCALDDNYSNYAIVTNSELIYLSGLANKCYRLLQYEQKNLSNYLKIEADIVQECFSYINNYFKGYIRTALNNIESIDFKEVYVLIKLNGDNEEIHIADEFELEEIENIMNRSFNEINCKNFNDVIFKRKYKEYKEVESKYMNESELSWDYLYFYKAYHIIKNDNYKKCEIEEDKLQEITNKINNVMYNKFVSLAEKKREKINNMDYNNFDNYTIRKGNKYIKDVKTLLNLLLLNEDNQLIVEVTKSNYKHEWSITQRRKTIKELYNDESINNLL